MIAAPEKGTCSRDEAERCRYGLGAASMDGCHTPHDVYSRYVLMGDSPSRLIGNVMY